MKKTDTSDVLKGAAAGLVGGIVASYAMGGFQTLLGALSPKKASEKPAAKKADEPTTVKAAEAVSEAVFDHRLTKSEKTPAGTAAHYAMGAASGLIYGVAAEIAPVSTVGAGLGFGAAVWLVADDAIVPALGFSKPMTAYPLSTNAYALASHLVYGLTTEAVRRGVRGLM